MSEIVFAPDGRRLHTCTVCGHIDTWGPEWQWYGTLDDPPEHITCSSTCRSSLPYPFGTVGK